MTLYFKNEHGYFSKKHGLEKNSKSLLTNTKGIDTFSMLNDSTLKYFYTHCLTEDF